MTNDVMGRTEAATARDDDALIELGDLTGGQSEAFCCHDSMRANATDTEGYDPEVVAAAERLSRRYAYRFVKRAFDIVFSLMVLTCFCWLFAVIAVVVKLDDPKGPVLFRQKRVTKDGREFTIYKFRSMFADAEERLAELRALNEKTGPVFKMRDDPRVTRVGRVLRRVSLAPVIIGTPGDGEPTKSLSHPVNSSLDLHKCERRPEPFLVAQTHYTSFQFLSFAVFGGLGAARGRRRCARGAASLRGLRAVA